MHVEQREQSLGYKHTVGHAAFLRRLRTLLKGPTEIQQIHQEWDLNQQTFNQAQPLNSKLYEWVQLNV